MVVRKEDDTSRIHLSEISSIVFQTTQVYMSAYLLAELAKYKVSVVISDDRYNPIGQYLPLYGAHNCSGRIGEQMAWGEPIKKRVWQRVVREKITQQMRLLYERDYDVEARILKASLSEVRSGDTTNREAHAARVYFAGIFGQNFNRDLECPTNGALNYGYAVLLSMVNREIVSRGYLTQCGICHRNEFNQFNLSCDLMEPFRPIVDRIVLDNLSVDFDGEVRRVLCDLANKRINYRDGSYRLSSVVSLYVQDCLNALNKKIAVDEIEGFVVP